LVRSWSRFWRLSSGKVNNTDLAKQHRLGVLRLLRGEVYDRQEVPVLAAMRKFIEAAEKSENHIFRQQLTDIPIDLTVDPDSIEAAS